MVSKQSKTQTKLEAVAEATKAAIMVVIGTEIPFNTTRPVPEMPKKGGPVLKELTLNWKFPYK